jgi:predicted glycosyltransferase involved in capsule biosynthesis
MKFETGLKIVLVAVILFVGLAVYASYDYGTRHCMQPIEQIIKERIAVSNETVKYVNCEAETVFFVYNGTIKTALIDEQVLEFCGVSP